MRYARICDFCGMPFNTTKQTQKFCSVRCRRRDENQRKRLIYIQKMYGEHIMPDPYIDKKLSFYGLHATDSGHTPDFILGF